MRSAVYGSLAALLVTLGGGCGNSTPGDGAGGRQPSTLDPQPSTIVQPQTDVVARVHWIGMKRLAAETNAASFMNVWNLPETAKLEAQTLDKLACWLATAGQEEVQSQGSDVRGRKSEVSNAQHATRNTDHAAQLRPLLDELVREEWYLEIQQATNQPGALALGIRLDTQRAALWQTNLASVVGGQWSVVSNRWSVALTRSGEWTILGLLGSPFTNHQSSITNRLVADFAARIQRHQTPDPSANQSFAMDPVTRRVQAVPGGTTPNYWLDATLDCRRLNSLPLFSDHASRITHHASRLTDHASPITHLVSSNLPTLSLSVTGDGTDVLTTGRLHFPTPLPPELEPWNIPTNLISEPLASFTAVRGIRPWLSSLNAWNELQAGPLPNQLYLWSRIGNSFEMSCAAPLPNASNCVDRIAQRLIQQANPWITNNSYGQLEMSTNLDGVTWTRLAFMQPFVCSASAGNGSFVVAGSIPRLYNNRPPPLELFQALLGRTNLVYYDWELTGPRTQSLFLMGQFARLLLRRAQLPSASGMAWLDAVKPRLGNCVTVVTRDASADLSFTRKSSVGFTAFELHLLADWLESPQFPRTLHTLAWPPQPLSRLREGLPAARSGPKLNPGPPPAKGK